MVNQTIDKDSLKIVQGEMNKDYRKNIAITEFVTVLEVKKDFAEKHLSPDALALGVKKGNKYLYDWGGNAVVVAYELPCFFSLDFTIILRCMMTAGLSYAKKKEINDSNILTVYRRNMAVHYNSYAEPLGLPCYDVD